MDNQAVWRRGAPVRFPSARWELTFSRALRRENGGRLELALPYSPARPWPLPELFCFARVEEIGAVAAAGEKMPQKSTYFYPKLITGLVMNNLETPVKD